MKKIIKFISGKLFITSVLIMMQIIAYFMMFYHISRYSPYIYGFMTFLSIFFAFKTATGDLQSDFKVIWIFFLISVPIFSWIIYIIIRKKKIPERKQKNIRRVALHSARKVNEDVAMYEQILQNDLEYINRHGIEWHQKFTLSVACFVLFLIGAPFGSIVRKGGLGLPLVASVIFFVLYYVINTICIKAIRETALPPYGMWISTLAMLPLGIFLTLKATTDSGLFDRGTWQKIIRKKSKPFKQNK